ncbi:MAG TPA: hypothetical protein PLX97_01625 [Gemmatales bacterium]|nr:hypothetical protein [Gemmatales bacterium]
MRLLAFLFSCLAGFVYYLWAVAPLWTIGPMEFLQPASIDRSNGQLLVLLKKSSEWYFDTLDTTNGHCLKSVKLNIPADSRDVYFPFDSTHSTSLQLAAVYLRYQSNSKTFTGTGVVIVDVETGNLLSDEPMEVDMLRSAAHLHDKVIVPIHGSVRLLDKADQQHRSIKTEGYALVQFLPGGKHFVVCDDWQVMVVEWKTGKTVAHDRREKPRQHTVSRLFVVKPDEFLLGSYVDTPQLHLELERWRWNGTDQLHLDDTVQLQPQSTERQSRVGGRGVEWNRQGQLVISVFAMEAWPAAFRSLLAWLENRQWNVSKYIPKETLLTQITLGEDLREVTRQEVISGLNIPFRASTGIRFQGARYPSKERTLIAYRTNPQWPNAVAVALVCYLVCYVYFHRKRAIIVN